VDEVVSFLQEPFVTVGEISRDLAHPLAIGSRKDCGNLDSSSSEVYDKENEISDQARPSDHFDAEEISCRGRAFIDPSLGRRRPKKWAEIVDLMLA
jgi:hypothetical protein